jgi:hypothetical protein
MSMIRDSLNGTWILDKTREPWSMNEYLRTLNVDPLAIQAHEKGEKEQDTFHTIELDRHKVKIIKRSRVNNDLVVELVLGQEKVELLPPGERPKRSMATSDDLCHLELVSSLLTVNGNAFVTDTKTLLQESDKSVLRQNLTIVNETSGQSHTTTRYFLPYLDLAPHLIEEKPDPDMVEKQNPTSV